MSKGKTAAPDNRALYRKYRSKSLEEVVGQEHIVEILGRAIEQGKIAHAYLFTGPRGVGKTSVARILAHQINNLPYDETTQHPDIIEIDAASNRRIDDIRDLRDKVQIAPTSAPYKVYIIDEVHMLTGESFNAFLKTLEEPPAHVVFILATTDAHKLPVTVTSRTQRFAFRAITAKAATAHLAAIAKKEKINIDDEALGLIAEYGDGSFRDSISLLDQLSSLASKDEPISTALVESVLGIADGSRITALLEAYQAGNQGTIISSVNELEQSGVGAVTTASQLIRAVRQQLATTPNLTSLLANLVEVFSSPRPDIKLLVSLLANTSSSPNKVLAAIAPVAPELRTLEQEATKPRPSEKAIRQASQATPKLTSAPGESKTIKASPKPTKKTQPAAAAATVEFDWPAYVQHLKEGNLALATILTKCKAESDGSKLTIYAGTAFWKKKLDDIKYQPILHEALAILQMGDLTIEILPSTMPPKDSQAAAVAAIMGGGEEIEL